MIKLNLKPGQGYTPIAAASQYDVGRELVFTIYDGMAPASIPSGTIATMVGTKPSGLGFTTLGTVYGNEVTVVTTATMTAEGGHIPAELRLTYNGKNIGTANFVFGVEPSPHPEDVTDGDAETARDLMTRAEDAVTEAESAAQSAAASAARAEEAAAGAGLDATGAGANQVPTADGNGNWCWQNQQGGGGGGSTSDDITNESSVSGETVTDALNALSGEIANLEGGAPTPAATVSAMVDTTKIYLYTGSETGYNAGHWYYYSGGQWVDGGQYGEAASMSAGVKAALLACFQHVAWIDDQGQTYYDNLYNELYPPASLVSITATYTQSGTVYDTASLDDLKPDLVVTANYSDSTSETVTTYTLSGTLTVGTSTVTVSYGGKTTSFTVTVTHYDPYWMTLTLDDDFVALGLQDAKGSNPTYPYTQASTNRTSYPFFDILISSDYKYTFEYDGTSVSLGIPYYSSGAETAVANGASISSYKTDAGWKNTGYSFTPPAGSWCMRLTLNNSPTNLASAGFTTLHITREAVS